jgi:hypothetical protein
MWRVLSSLIDIRASISRDKPVNDSVSDSPKEAQSMSHPSQFHQEQEHKQYTPEFNRSDSNSNDSLDNNLPPGWIASVDPASGSEYYFNEETGETTW